MQEVTFFTKKAALTPSPRIHISLETCRNAVTRSQYSALHIIYLAVSALHRAQELGGSSWARNQLELSRGRHWGPTGSPHHFIFNPPVHIDVHTANMCYKHWNSAVCFWYRKYLQNNAENYLRKIYTILYTSRRIISPPPPSQFQYVFWMNVAAFDRWVLMT